MVKYLYLPITGIKLGKISYDAEYVLKLPLRRVFFFFLFPFIPPQDMKGRLGNLAVSSRLYTWYVCSTLYAGGKFFKGGRENRKKLKYFLLFRGGRGGIILSEKKRRKCSQVMCGILEPVMLPAGS